MSERQPPRATTPSLHMMDFAGSVRSVLNTLPITVIGFWVLATLSNRLNEDQQMWLFFGAVLPFTVACCIGSVGLPNHGTELSVIVGRRIGITLLAAALVWPMMILSVMALDPLPLPMLNEHTPAIFTIWTTFFLGWIFLVCACHTILILINLMRLMFALR